MKRFLHNIILAFPLTIPVLTGYLFLGFGFGVLMKVNGFPIGLILIMAVVVFAGALQYFAVLLLTMSFSPLYAFAMTLMINARHMFYGIPLLKKFKGTGTLKFYLIYGLTDETFSLQCAASPPNEEEKGLFYASITLLDHLYWIVGCVLGGVVGSLVSFNTKGLDFVLTALFMVIFINQWQADRTHTPAIIGVFSAALCRLLFGAERFLIPSMLCILFALACSRRVLYRKEDRCDKS